jgi:hypothetical protein
MTVGVRPTFATIRIRFLHGLQVLVPLEMATSGQEVYGGFLVYGGFFTDEEIRMYGAGL